MVRVPTDGGLGTDGAKERVTPMRGPVCRAAWTDKGTDPEMGDQAPGDVAKRFYRIGVE
jgi:hypothetical protein